MCYIGAPPFNPPPPSPCPVNHPPDVPSGCKGTSSGIIPVGTVCRSGGISDPISAPHCFHNRAGVFLKKEEQFYNHPLVHLTSILGLMDAKLS